VISRIFLAIWRRWHLDLRGLYPNHFGTFAFGFIGMDQLLHSNGNKA
jgi:hypothetical protein